MNYISIQIANLPKDTMNVLTHPVTVFILWLAASSVFLIFSYRRGLKAYEKSIYRD